ncbi:MAG: hypothetical protein K9M51_01475 [Candidatus Gracilibacteria bacterium]|nr:hypothetical protein [Candidatus Gracilibacteria bacterium]
MFRIQENSRTQAVFEALAEKLRDLKAYEKQVIWTHADFRWMKLETGIGMKEVTEILEPFSIGVYRGYADDDEYYPEENFYHVPNAGITWQKFGKHFEIVVNDRKKLRGFINAQRGLQYSVYPHKKLEYRDIIFDLTTGEILKSGQQIDKIELGTDYEKLIKLLLENRGYNFSYLELARALGLEQLYVKNKFDTEKSISTKFSRLNAKCREKVFQCNNGYFLAI